MFIKSKKLAVSVLLSLASVSVFAQTKAFVNFEKNPSIPVQPSTFVGAYNGNNPNSPYRTIFVPGAATFTGGVVLGFPTNFPAITYATSPNVYGTASTNIVGGGDPALLPTLTIEIDPSNLVHEVSFPLFNGNTYPVSYTATAFDGLNQVAVQHFLNIPSNTSSGTSPADLLAPNITSVTVSIDDPSRGWDFLIDSVAFNQSVKAVVPGVPGPAALMVFVIGAATRRRRRG